MLFFSDIFVLLCKKISFIYTDTDEISSSWMYHHFPASHKAKCCLKIETCKSLGPPYYEKLNYIYENAL